MTLHTGVGEHVNATHTAIQVAPRKTRVMGPEGTWACGPAGGTLSIPRGNLLPDENIQARNLDFKPTNEPGQGAVTLGENRRTMKRPGLKFPRMLR